MRYPFQDAVQQPQSEQEFIRRDEDIARSHQRTQDRINANSPDPDALAHSRPSRTMATLDESDWRTHLERAHDFIALAAQTVEHSDRARLISKAQISLETSRNLLP